MRERTEVEKQRETFEGFYKEVSEFLAKYENDLGVRIVINFNAYGNCGKAKTAILPIHEELGLYEIAKMDIQSQLHNNKTAEIFKETIETYLPGEEEEEGDED